MTTPPGNTRVPRHRRPLIDELIDAARAGDRATFDRLFDLWFGAVLADAQRNLKDRTLAHELTGTLLRRTVAARLAPAGSEDPGTGEHAAGSAAVAENDAAGFRAS